MQNDGVQTAFELILEEIGSVSRELKQEAKRLIDKGEYESVSGLMETGKGLDAFQLKVKDIQAEWINTFDPATRNKTHFKPLEIKPPRPETLSLSMTYGEAYAEAEYLGKKVRLLTGSKVRAEFHDSLGDHIKEMKTKAIKNGDVVPLSGSDLYELRKPIVFNSPSAAACFVAGCSVSGPREWQVKDKGRSRSLKYWLSKKQ